MNFSENRVRKKNTSSMDNEKNKPITKLSALDDIEAFNAI